MNELDIVVEAALDDKLFTSAVIGVRRTGRVEDGFIKAWSVPDEAVAASSLFDLASLTKLFTATAILRLVDIGAMDLHTKVLDLLAFSDATVRARLSNVDIASLMTHSSSLPAWFPLYTRRGQDFETIFADICAKYPPVTGVLYSDFNFILLGMIVAQLSARSLDLAMSDLVLRPLGLVETTYHPCRDACVATEFGNRIERKMVSELGLSFDGWRDERRAFQGECDDGNACYYFNGVSGHAGLFSSVRDLLSLGEAYLEPSSCFLSPQVKNLSLQEWEFGRGLGWQCGELYPGGGFGHTGFTGTYLAVYPASGLTIIILTNRLHVEKVRDINGFRKEIASLLAYSRP